jgi:hypothetical protein
LIKFGTDDEKTFPLFYEQEISYTVKDKLIEQAYIINSGDFSVQASISYYKSSVVDPDPKLDPDPVGSGRNHSGSG